MILSAYVLHIKMTFISLAKEHEKKGLMKYFKFVKATVEI